MGPSESSRPLPAIPPGGAGSERFHIASAIRERFRHFGIQSAPRVLMAPKWARSSGQRLKVSQPLVAIVSDRSLDIR